ncbi:MAG: hypothetical protein JWM86_2008 [Thermoleophilia bacterium]|nr:hypothetical protein [Thermoleophilia bacterium]
MSGTTRRPGSGSRTTHGADPWWGGDVDVDGTGFVDLDAPVTIPATSTAARRPARRSAPRSRVLPAVLGLLALPFLALVATIRRSPRLRRYAVRMLVLGAILTALACSVGVILINNVVIGRTAELGRLDDQRRELRRENALLGAEAAQLSAPQVIERKARMELGMVRPDRLPRFIFLDPASRTLTPLQRRLVAARNARLEAARAAAAAPATPATTVAGRGASGADPAANPTPKATP